MLDAPALRLVSLQKADHAGRKSDRCTTRQSKDPPANLSSTHPISCRLNVAGHLEARPQWTVWLHPNRHRAVSTCTAQNKVRNSATAWRHSACTCAARDSCRNRTDPQTDQTNQHDAKRKLRLRRWGRRVGPGAQYMLLQRPWPHSSRHASSRVRHCTAMGPR